MGRLSRPSRLLSDFLRTSDVVRLPSSSRSVSSLVSAHTSKWMQDTSKKSPMELINEVPPIKVNYRIVACEGDSNPALGHPIEFICLDKKEPAICKYCGLRNLKIRLNRFFRLSGEMNEKRLFLLIAKPIRGCRK